MNVTCQVVQDLLPLYAENLASEDTIKLVEEHLKDCPACQRRLEDLQRPLPVPADRDLALLENFRDRVNRRRERVVTLVSLLILLTIISLSNYLIATHRVVDADAYIHVYSAGGKIYVKKTPEIQELDISYEIDQSQGEYICYLDPWRKYLDLPYGSHSNYTDPNNPSAELQTLKYPAKQIAAVYLMDGSGEAKLLYGDPVDASKRRNSVEDHSLALTFWIVFLSAIIFTGQYVKRSRQRNCPYLFPVVALFSWAYLLSHLWVKGWNFVSAQPEWELSAILAVVGPMMGVLYLFYRLWKILWRRYSSYMTGWAAKRIQKIYQKLENHGE